ncbi:Pr6Pr family membrane protein [Stenotrophomonas sp.]|uniref:Pr6Pr family membrane protein n=1 Tax=Stenotrophomonas sp. TaxID=69392 RepID=UPI0028AE2472|nr:Pr6Pr family membrane protein [Stenotrophomonas sp.]
MRAPSTVARYLAGLTALVALLSLVLQFVLLMPAGSGLGGVGSAAWRFLGYFTVLSNIGVAVVCLARANGHREGLAGPAPRAAVALYIAITGLVYVLLLRALWHPQGAQWWADIGLHYAVPVLYLLGWALGEHGGLHWRQLLLALLVPVVYLGWALLLGQRTGQYPYPFLDWPVLGWKAFLGNVATMALAFTAFGALLWKVDQSMSRR